MSQVILRFPKTKERVGLSRSTIYLKIARGEFPRQISLSTRAVGFLESEIEAWLESRIEQSRKAA